MARTHWNDPLPNTTRGKREFHQALTRSLPMPPGLGVPSAPPPHIPSYKEQMEAKATANHRTYLARLRALAEMNLAPAVLAERKKAARAAYDAGVKALEAELLADWTPKAEAMLVAEQKARLAPLQRLRAQKDDLGPTIEALKGMEPEQVRALYHDAKDTDPWLAQSVAAVLPFMDWSESGRRKAAELVQRFRIEKPDDPGPVALTQPTERPPAIQELIEETRTDEERAAVELRREVEADYYWLYDAPDPIRSYLRLANRFGITQPEVKRPPDADFVGPGITEPPPAGEFFGSELRSAREWAQSQGGMADPE